MPNRYAQCSLINTPYLLALLSVFCVSLALAQGDTELEIEGDIALEIEGDVAFVEDDMMSPEQLMLRTVDRRLDLDLSAAPITPDYEIISKPNAPAPEPYVVPLQEVQPDDVTVIAAAEKVEPDPFEGFTIIEAAEKAKPKLLDTWLIVQDNAIESVGEAGVYARVSQEYDLGQCLPGFDCPASGMELPEWPAEAVRSDSNTAPSEVFRFDVITPFSPIPELDALPFPTN